MALEETLFELLAQPASRGEIVDTKEAWRALCVCGHADDFHSPEIGGRFEDKHDSGFRVEGCRGATPNRDVEVKRIALDDYVYTPTCPCEEMRPVADVDRPGRTFRQKVYTKDFVHPFTRGMKAMFTWVRGMKGISDPVVEFERRIVMRSEAQVCAVCGAKGEKVMPAYSTKKRDSEMRCPEHYIRPIG